MKKKICEDFCKDHSIQINLVGWSRGVVIVMEVAEELEDDGCCCKKDKKKYYPTVNWMGLFDAVDMTVTWGWANNITSNVKNASHIKKSKKQKAALSWMIDQVKNAGVQMRGMRKSYYVK